MNAPNVLLVTHVHSEHIGAVSDHIKAILATPGMNIFKVDCSSAEYIDLNCFDVVLLHYSLVIASESYISARLRGKLGQYEGLTILFIQDEYRWINATAEAMRELKVDVVFSLVEKESVRKVYHHPFLEHVQFEYTLTGFVPEHLADFRTPKYEDRPIDIGYRARKLPGWYGRHAEQKYRIADRMLADTKPAGLVLDVATDEASRIYGDAWVRFIANCKAVLGTESGASVCDFTGEIQRLVEQHVARNPSVTDDELRRLYFEDVDGKITMPVVSPRVFEAAALRTLMIMYPGHYSGVLTAGKHYVVLEPDHSNIDEVLAILKSPERAATYIEAAYQDIVRSGRWSYKAFAEHIARVIRQHVPDGKAARVPYIQLRWHMMLAHVRGSPKALILRAAPKANKMAARISDGVNAMPAPIRNLLHPVLGFVWNRGMMIAKAILRRA